jgi:hypothetical protein
MVIAKILQMAVLIGIAAPAWGQNISQPDLPIRIRVPVDHEAVLTAHATGSQIYVCQPGKEGKATWTLMAPEATLQDTHGATIGRHYAGPTWRKTMAAKLRDRSRPRLILRIRILFLGSSSPFRSDVGTARSAGLALSESSYRGANSSYDRLLLLCPRD